jgi:hypothetical protein
MRFRVFPFLLFSLSLAVTGFSQTLIFPHIADGLNADGSRWATEIDLVNTTSQIQTARISFFNPDGTQKCFTFPRWETELNGCPGTAVVTIQPNRLRPIIIDSAFGSATPVATAWALIEGSGGIKGVLSFRRIEGFFDGRIIAEASFTAQNPLPKVDFFPKTNLLAGGGQSKANTVYLGLAMANPDPLFEAAGEVQLVKNLDSGPEIVARYPFTLPRRGQSAKYLEEMFGTKADDTCYARIVMTSGTVSAIGLRTVDVLISSIPPSEQG